MWLLHVSDGVGPPEQSTGGLTPVDYLFGGGDRELRT
jgi:hypothetical protein